MIHEDHIWTGPAREDFYSRAKQGNAHPVTRKQKFRLFEFGTAGAGRFSPFHSKKERGRRPDQRREGNNKTF